MAIKLEDESYKMPTEGCKVDKSSKYESKYTPENTCEVLGATLNTPIKKEQDKQALSLIQYGVVFFPKIIEIKAGIKNYSTVASLASTPEAAIVKFMDKMNMGEKWEVYESVGWKVRLIELVDCGDAEMPEIEEG